MAHRVSFLVDGFNLYHSLREVERLTKARVRWLDLRALCEGYLHAVRGAVGERVDLASVAYFSAFATHLSPNNLDVVARHQSYVSALKSTGIEIVLSRFKQKTVTCPICGGRFKRHEEKETDVALGLHLVELFARGACETAVLITGDTDLVPAIRSAKRLYPLHAVGVGFPFMRHNAELRGVADFSFNIGQRDLQRAQLPYEVEWDGHVITRPASW